MKLDFNTKQKLTERILRKIGVPESIKMIDIYVDLLSGLHIVNIMTRGKFTVVEIKYERNGYCHHFLGVSAKNPNDVVNATIGIKNAMEDAITKLLIKFIFEE
jgi:hypothetical protein